MRPLALATDGTDGAVPLLIDVAAHPDQLVGELCRRLAEPLDDPFAREIVAVPTRGIERWLTQRIASGLADQGVGAGICANVDFPSPARLVEHALGAIPDIAPSLGAWEGRGLAAHLLAAIDEHLDEPWLAVIRRHVRDGTTAANRYTAATKVARLFTQYARRRPAMIRSWAAGHDTGPDGGEIAGIHAWQPQLWRTVRASVDRPSLPELLPEALDPLRNGEVQLDLPPRLFVYGLTAIDPLDLDVLAAIGAGRDVRLSILHPSPVLWRAVAGIARTGTLPNRRTDPTARSVVHPLLRSWAQDSRELQLVMAASGLGGDPGPVQDRRSTVLGRLQQEVAGNTEPQPGALDPDRSVQVHSCHGPRRQVEVLRDAILHLLADDATLEPRDIAIMTPDLRTFAPLLEAAFPIGADRDGQGLPDLRVRIADRSPAATNPLVRFVATLLDLADSRLEAAAVRDLVSNPLVQQRFGFDDDTAGSVVAVIDDAHIAWGLDSQDRLRWRVGDRHERTWRRGLDRALAGVFFADSPVRIVADAAPLHGVEGQEAEPVGILAALVDRLAAVRDRFAEPMLRSEWAAAVGDAVRTLAAPAWGDEWQLDQLDRLLADTFPPATGGPDPLLHLHEARRAASTWTDERPSPLHFQSGNVTVCTLVPMRSVPYRVICLLGMDDDRFPRTSRSDGDDLLATHEQVGDHDRAAQDRQLLLDALMAAEDAVVVTYTGRDEITNAPLPPAVPVAELLDVVSTMTGTKAADLVVEHPLQPFSERNFRVDAGLGTEGPWGFDATQLAGAEAARGRQGDEAPADTLPWPEFEPPGDVVALDDLVTFLVHPARRFVRQRLGFTIPNPGDTPDDSLPVELGGLGRWAVTERLLGGLLSGHPLDALVARERRSDSLPPGNLAEAELADVIETAQRLADAAAGCGYEPDRQLPHSGLVTLADRAVEGSVVADAERALIVMITASRIKARQRLQIYARQVFLTALDPDVPWRSVLIGKRQRGNEGLSVTLEALGGTADERAAGAASRLATLVELYDEGHRTPIPLPCETAYLWQRGRAGNRTDDARIQWEEDKFTREQADVSHRLVLPRIRTFGDLTGSGFVDYCARLWEPILPLIREAPL